MNTYSKNNSTVLSRKKIIRDIACTNCGSRRHTFKQCSVPVTSWGIILVTYGEMNQPIHLDHVDLSDTDMKETQSRVLIESNLDRMIVSSAYHNIKFLMISRKNSVGYVEFIRGRYRPEKIDQVIYLFKQMMQTEIDKITHSLTIEKGFDYLWKDFWGTKAESYHLIKDKTVSRANYDMLKVKGVEGPELDLKYIVSTVKAEYDIEEWGFPKGRKKPMETEEECAVREFKEESGYSDEDFRVIKNIEPMVEEFIGTNGIRYRHVYYVAELISDKPPSNDLTESQKDEIGSVQFMGFTSALECIRDYHIPRKILLEKLFTYYLDRLVVANRNPKTIQSINQIQDLDNDTGLENATKEDETKKMEKIQHQLNLASIASDSDNDEIILVKSKKSQNVNRSIDHENACTSSNHF